jgi:hypothetical protein
MLRQLVVAQCRLAAEGAPGGITVQWQSRVAELAVPVTQQAECLENESGKMLNNVQNGLNLQLHRWSLVRWFAFLSNSQTKRSHRDKRWLFPGARI